MTEGQRVGAILLHQHGDLMGNLLWPGELPAKHSTALPDALAAITARGYFASPFPEGDGVTFNRRDGAAYDPDQSLTDFRDAFPFLDVAPLDEAEGQPRALARLAGDRTVRCRYLAPVEGLRLDAPFQLGKTRFHPPVDGVERSLADHAWRDLCDVPGADIDPGWAPQAGASGTTELLAYPLIERTIEIPLSAYYEAGRSFDSQSELLRLLMKDADHALDPVRFGSCHYRRLEYLPAKPGWIGDTALVLLMPESRALNERFLLAKPYVLRVSNNWLGLEVNHGALSGISEALADIVDRNVGDGITLALKSALRAWNRAFYLVELEASFLHLVYAIDALCEPGALRGDRHRLWISAYASGGDVTRFTTILDQFNQHYGVRNRIVHEGRTFADLRLVGEEQCQFMLDLLGSCIQTFHGQGFASRREAAEFAFGALTTASITPLVAAMGSTQFKLPLTADKGFAQHMQP